MDDDAALGYVAYAGYKESTGGKTFDGRLMPRWEDLGDPIRQAWIKAASAVADAVVANVKREDL